MEYYTWSPKSNAANEENILKLKNNKNKDAR